MTTYTVHFYTHASWAVDQIEADSPSKALECARRIANGDDPGSLDFTSYDATSGIDHIEVFAEDGHLVDEWQHADLLIPHAASELLEVLEELLTVPDLNEDALDEHTAVVIAKAVAVITKVKGGVL